MEVLVKFYGFTGALYRKKIVPWQPVISSNVDNFPESLKNQPGC
jgi:hypothetical protein